MQCHLCYSIKPQQHVIPSDHMSAFVSYGVSFNVSHATTSGAILRHDTHTHTHTLNETTQRNDNISYAVVTRKVKLFQNYFSLCRRPSELIMPEIISKLFQRLIAAHEYFPTC